MNATPEMPGPNQALRLTIENRHFPGLVVSMSEEVMLVATTLREKPDLPIGATATGEMVKPDGVYHFATRVKGFQLLPMLVFILDRPKAMRRIQRRAHTRFATDLEAHLIFISSDKSLNQAAQVTNLSPGGMELQVPEAPSLGFHCIVLFQYGDRQFSTICQTIHASQRGAGMRLGVSFVEMSRDDREALAAILAQMQPDER